MFDNDEPVFAVTSNLLSLAGILYKKKLFHSWLNPIVTKFSCHAKTYFGSKIFLIFCRNHSPFLISPFSHRKHEVMRD